MIRPGFLSSEVLTGFRRNGLMAISVILVTMISMFILGLGVLAQKQANTMKGFWGDRIQVSIYLCTKTTNKPNCEGHAVTESQKTTLRQQLEALPEVKQVFYESEAEAYDRFKEQFKASEALAQTVRRGDIPPSFRVQLKDPKTFPVITQQFEGAPGVSDVQDQQKVLGIFIDIAAYVTRFAVGLALAMGLCAALLMATTIRQAAFVRRREVGIMRLVGASNWTIRMPFVIEMVLVSLVGVGLAVLLLWILLRYLLAAKSESAATSGQAWIGTGDLWPAVPWMALGVALLAFVTSLVTLRRSLRV